MKWGLGGEERDTMNSQMGYITAKVEELDKFIRHHMIEEETRISSINQTITMQRRYLIGLTLLVFLDSSGYPVHELMKIFLKAIL